MIPDYPDLTEAQRRQDLAKGYDACITAMRLAGIREGRYEPIQSDEVEMETARQWTENNSSA